MGVYYDDLKSFITNEGGAVSQFDYEPFAGVFGQDARNAFYEQNESLIFQLFKRSYLPGRTRYYDPIGHTGHEIINATNYELRYATFSGDAWDAVTDSKRNLTNGLDTTTRAGMVRYVLENDTGSNDHIIGVAILGKPIVRLSGEMGLLHDEFIDYEAIEKEGEKLFEIGNNYIVYDDTFTNGNEQIDRIADFYWKKLHKKKHIYVLEMHGRRLWYELGEHFTLSIGSAGNPEYIDSTARLTNIEYDSQGVGTTVLTFEEIEESWKFDSTATARYLAKGGWKLKGGTGPRIVLASSDYTSSGAHYYCDGTSDETEINEAIDYLSGAYDRYTVELVGSTFYIDGSINLKSGLTLEGNGCVIERDSDTYGLYGNGSSGSELSDITLRNLTLKETTSIANNNALLHCDYTDFLQAENIIVYTSYQYGIRLEDCDQLILQNIRTATSGTNDIYIKDCDYATISDININRGTMTAIGQMIGFYCRTDNSQLTNINVFATALESDYNLTGIIISGNNNNIANISVENQTGTDDGLTIRGIYLLGDYNTISNVFVDGMDAGIFTTTQGLYIAGDNNKLSGVVTINGSDAGIVIATGSSYNSLVGVRSYNNTNFNFTDSGTDNSIEATV